MQKKIVTQSSRNRGPLWLYPAIAITLLSWRCCAVGLAQENVASYPTSPLIAPSMLSAENRKDLETLIDSPLTKDDARKITQRLCPHSIVRSPIRHESLRGSVTETKVATVIELLFEKSGSASSSLIESFSLAVDFSSTRVLMRHTRPRFPSDRAGYSAPLSIDTTRAVRIEGEMGADAFMLIPPARECRVQAIAVCPRRYEKVQRLVPAPYELKKMRIIVQAKADAVVATSEQSPLKVMVSNLGTPGISVPSQWFQSVSGTKTLSVTQSISHDLASSNALPPFEVIESFPKSIGVESRVDIGTETSVLHSAHKRTNVEVNTIAISSKPNLFVGRAPLSVEDGPCYMVTQWSDESL